MTLREACGSFKLECKEELEEGGGACVQREEVVGMNFLFNLFVRVRATSSLVGNIPREQLEWRWLFGVVEVSNIAILLKHIRS